MHHAGQLVWYLIAIRGDQHLQVPLHKPQLAAVIIPGGNIFNYVIVSLDKSLEVFCYLHSGTPRNHWHPIKGLDPTLKGWPCC